MLKGEAPPGYLVQTRHAASRDYKVVLSPAGKVLKSLGAAWKHYAIVAPPPEADVEVPSRSLPPAPSVEKPSVEKSPGMQHFLRSRASSVYSTLALAADVLQTLVGSLGPDTELFRAYAAASVLAYPILRHTRSQETSKLAFTANSHSLAFTPAKDKTFKCTIKLHSLQQR